MWIGMQVVYLSIIIFLVIITVFSDAHYQYTRVLPHH